MHVPIWRVSVHADLRDIEEAASRIPVQGERLPESVLKFTNG